MDNFDFYSPTYFAFGDGQETRAGELVRRFGGSRVLVLYGTGSVQRNGVLDKVLAALDGQKIPYCVEGGIQPNPRLAKAQALADAYAGKGIDFLLGVGGASVLDTCKAVAIGLACGGSIWDYFCKVRPITGALPVGSVLTIAAAGSETSDSAVLTDEATDSKRGCNTPFNRPAFAILDPTLTYTLPAYQTACGAADMMLHTMERYFVQGDAMEITDSIAEGLLRTVMAQALILRDDPQNYDARAEVMWAGSLSHNGLTGCGTGGGKGQAAFQLAAQRRHRAVGLHRAGVVHRAPRAVQHQQVVGGGHHAVKELGKAAALDAGGDVAQQLTAVAGDGPRRHQAVAGAEKHRAAIGAGGVQPAPVRVRRRGGQRGVGAV